MRIGYLPIVTKGGSAIGEVFDYKSPELIIKDMLKLFTELGQEVSYIGNSIITVDDWEKSEKLFKNESIDVLFIHNLNIVGGEALYNLIKTLNVPVLISAVPEPDDLYKPPYTSRYASYCGGQWNMNMCYLLDVKARFLFGNPSEKEFKNSVNRTLKALETIKKIHSWKVCVIGDKTPGYYGAIYSEDMLMRKFGAKVVYLDFGILKIMAEEVDKKEVKIFILKNFNSKDINENLYPGSLENTVRTYLALEKYSILSSINSYTMKCVPETIYILGASPCGINSLLTENCLISGCEGDVLATLTMQIAYWLSDKKPLQVDIMSIREPEESLLFWHCGAGAKSIAGNNKITYANSPILCNKNNEFQGVCVDFIPEFDNINLCQLTEDWKKNNYRFFTADGEALKTEPFIGGNPVRAKFNEPGEELGYYITSHYLPHHFQITGKHMSDLIEEICLWKDIELLRV